MSTAELIVVIAVLGAGTYGLRLGGVLLARRVPAQAEGVRPASRLATAVTRLLPYAAVALLAALAATAAFTESGRFAGVSRPAGVIAGLIAGLLRAPFAVAVVIAAGVAAGLRLLGVR
jgi:hypothetical protein